MKTFKIASLEADAGKRVTGHIDVVRRFDGTSISIPVVLINGSTEGPVLCVDACVHGDEYVGVAAINRTCSRLDPKKMKGTLVAIPVLNVPAFEAGTRCSPIDGLNLNRVFPGRPDGSVTERIANILFTNIIPKVNYVCDLHADGIYGRIKSADYRGGTPLVDQSLELAENFGFDIVVKNIPWLPGRLDSEAPKIGVPAIAPECGGEARCPDTDVQSCERAIRNLMIHLNMIEGTQELPREIKYVENCLEKVEGRPYTKGIAKESGFGIPHVREGQEVFKGDLVYTLQDIFGDVKESFKAPENGVVVGIRTFPSVRAGSELFDILKIIRRRVR